MPPSDTTKYKDRQILWMGTEDLADANNTRSRRCRRDEPPPRSPASKNASSSQILKLLPGAATLESFGTLEVLKNSNPKLL